MTDHYKITFPVLDTFKFEEAAAALVRALSPAQRSRRTWQPARVQWNHRARILATLDPADRWAHMAARPYLIAHPEREVAVEVYGMGHCRACGEWFTTSARERILSPTFLRAQRWAHAHNAERHPRRWLREQRFQAPIPVEIRRRAASVPA